MDEARRGARIATRFLVAVEGLDPAPVLRKGDISSTGVYFETERDVGDVGTVQSLALTSLDRSRSVRVMAHVVRTVKLADVAGRHISGAAFEFMPESDEAAAQVHDFVRRVLSVRKQGETPSIAPRLGARVADGAAPDSATSHDATVQSLSVRTMVLETSWAIQPGEHLRVDIVAPGMTRRLRLDGLAVRVAPRPGTPSRYDIEVEVQQEQKRPIRIDSSMAMSAMRIDPEQLRQIEEEVTQPGVPSPASDDDVTHVLDELLSALILPPEDDSARRRHTHLSGELSRIRLPTLFSLFEMEKLNGKLVVQSNGAEARVFFAGGRIVDVEPLAQGESARARIAGLLAVDEGTFDFVVEKVQRPDRLRTTTTALFLDIAREADEERANAGMKPT